jgi:hypothetical protein
VLAAGAYGSAAILPRSGLPPPVGENLRDHVGAGVGWEPTAKLVADVDAVTMAQVSIRLRDGELFLFPALDDGPQISAAAFAMKPRSTGRVRLNDRDPRTPLAIDTASSRMRAIWRPSPKESTRSASSRHRCRRGRT